MTEFENENFKNGNFKNHILNEKNIPITKKFIDSIFKKYDFNHKVKNLEIFQLAMIHVSYLNRSIVNDKIAKILKDVIPIDEKYVNDVMPLQTHCYGRLEFYGDAVIHCILAEYLFDRYNDQGEGFLTKLRTKIEKAETLSELSKRIGLDKYAVIARNVEQSNGRQTDVHLTEDIFEAFIGALSLEVKYEKCKQFLISLIETELDIVEMISTNDNYKDRLIQYLYKENHPIPKYVEDISQRQNIKKGCQEIKIFTIYVKSNNEVIGIGQGNTKSKAEQNSAYNALVKFGVIKNNDDNNSDYYGELSDNSDNSDSDDYFDK